MRISDWSSDVCSSDLVARKAAYCAGRHRLGTEGVGRLLGEAQEVAGKEEAGDLAQAVGQQLVDLDGAGGDIEDIAGRLALVEQRCAGLQFERRPQGGELGQPQGIEQNGRASVRGIVCKIVKKWGVA